MVALGFLNKHNAPTETAKLALPGDLVCPTQAVLDKTVVFFHDKVLFRLMKISQHFGEQKALL